MLQQPREELLKGSRETEMRKRTKCYLANIVIGGILTTVLIDTGAEATCLSEGFVNKNKERLQVYPKLTINGVSLVGPMGGKAIRLRRQIYADVQLPNYLIQVILLVVSKLFRSCNLKERHAINSIRNLGNDTEVSKEEIRMKIEEKTLIKSNEKEQLEDLVWKHKSVFRKTPGRLTTYQHRLQVEENQTSIGRSYPVPVAYRDKADEEIKRMLEMGIIQRSCSSYIKSIVPVVKKRCHSKIMSRCQRIKRNLARRLGMSRICRDPISEV